MVSHGKMGRESSAARRRRKAEGRMEEQRARGREGGLAGIRSRTAMAARRPAISGGALDDEVRDAASDPIRLLHRGARYGPVAILVQLALGLLKESRQGAWGVDDVPLPANVQGPHRDFLPGMGLWLSSCSS